MSAFADAHMHSGYGLPRKVVIQNGINTFLGIGGVKRNHIQFKVHCHLSAAATIDKVKDRGDVTTEENPCLARTINEIFTILPSQRETRIHTPGPQQSAIRYANIKVLGQGQFRVSALLLEKMAQSRQISSIFRTF
jgi:hypothetical protein